MVTAYLDLIEARSAAIADAARRLARARARGENPTRYIARLADALRWSMASADLLARAAVIRRRQMGRKAATFAAAPADLVPEVPRVPFLEAIEDLLGRVAVGIRAELADRAKVVAEVYSERRAFALARLADEVITAKVRDKIASLLERGVPEDRAAEEIAEEAGGISEAYAKTAYRTNVATAYRAGQFREAADPATRRFLPAFRFETAGDVDVRGHPGNRLYKGPENHWALHGVVARTDSPTWGRWSPPGGFSCRCSLRLLDREDLAEYGIAEDIPEPRVPAEARFHENFSGRRPDVELYGRVARS